MAKRVTESISSRTCSPWSRKYSAVLMATNAAWRRSSGASSEVAATTTLRFRPSGPRSSSMNSLSSRPRSPTRPMTMTSASVLRASMPSSIDLPTPDAGEDAHALALAAGDEGVERAHAEIELAADARACMRRWRRRAQRIGLHALRQHAFAVDRHDRTRRPRGRARRSTGGSHSADPRMSRARRALRLEADRTAWRARGRRESRPPRRGFPPLSAAIFSRAPRPIAPAAPVTSTSRPSILATRPNRVIRGRFPTVSISSCTGPPIAAPPPPGARPQTGAWAFRTTSWTRGFKWR